MNQFLQETREKLASLPAGGRVHAVLGNEACDLDSAVATLVTGYLLGATRPAELVVPLLNIAEDQYPLKTEVAFFLHKLCISKDLLVFRPALDLATLHRDGRLAITLVDRHRLDGLDAALASAVVQVIDHHQSDRPLSDDVTIEMVGSCCSLVAERLFSVNRALIDRTVADLLLGTILLDTVNLSTEAGRVTAKDRLMVSFLEPLSSGEGQNRLFEMLVRARGDVSQLSSYQLLNKDQKTVEAGAVRLVISSVPMLVKEFLLAPDAVSACNQLCEATARDLLLVMGSRLLDAEFSRDLAVFAVRDDLRHKVCRVLEEASAPSLLLSRQPAPHPRLVLYAQGNATASRKVVLPLLRTQLSVTGDSGDLSPIPRLGRAPPAVIHNAPRVELPSEMRPPNGVDLNLCSQVTTLLEPTSGGGSSSQSSAYNSVPYTPQNSVADSDSIADVTLPTFNSRELLQRIELRRGPLGGFEGADDVSAYPFTPKNSFVESSLETAYRHMNLSELDSEMILQKVREKKRKSNLFDDITEEEDGRAAGGAGESPPPGAEGGQDRYSVAIPVASVPSARSSTYGGQLVRMRTDRGPGPSTPDPALTSDHKAGSQGSLDESSSPPQPAARTGGSVAEGSFTSDPEEDTITFKSALSSSEAIRKKEDCTGVQGSAHPSAGDAGRMEPPVATNAPGAPHGGDPAKLWRVGDGRSVQEVAESRLSSSGPRSRPSAADSPESASQQLGNDPESISYVTSGPESLSLTEDDYYEDFTLPGTHEPVMSRQMSFRRRVRAAPVAVPDADRIEGVVRAGELERHGSIRRRLVAPPAQLAAASNGSPACFVRDLREIEELMAEDGEQVPVDELPSLGPVLGTSTPKGADDPTYLASLSEEPLSMEISTVMKVKECLDREKVRDIYKISGRLQDILTQEDIQEIMEHPEIYAELLGGEILMELKNSMSQSAQSTPPCVVSNAVTEPSVDSASPAAPPVPALNMFGVERQDLAPAPHHTHPDSSPDVTPTASPPNSITVRAEINNVADSGWPQPSPRHRIQVGADLSSDPELPHCEDAASSAGAPSPLPAGRSTPAAMPEGTLWRSGSLRQLSSQGRSIEALFAESEAPPAGCQRRLVAPGFDVGLEEGERRTCTPGADSLEAEEMVLTRQRLTPHSKPTDADSGVSDGTLAEHSGDDAGGETLTPAQSAERPASLLPPRRKISVSADVLGGNSGDGDSLSLSRLDSEQATPTEALATSDLLDTLTPDDIPTPDELEESILERLPPAEPIPEYSAREELQNERGWRTCVVAGLERRIDMKVIEPYKKVLSHGGYLGREAEQAIIVFSACYLPDRGRRDYSYVMDNLFLYVLTTLDALIADDYVLVYLHGATQRSCMPAFGWLKRCYQMVDRRLRKNLKGLYLVHPSFWVKTIVALTRPFISSKFSRKLRFVAGLRELGQLVPMDHVCIPDRVKQLDFQLMIAERKKQLGIR